MDWSSFIIDLLYQQIKTIIGLITGAVATWLIASFASYLKFRRFRSVFGGSVRSADDIILSMPQWTLMENSEHAPRYERVSPSGKISHHYGPSNTLAEHDVKGASLLISLVSEYFNKPAVIVSDGDVANFVKKTGLIFGSPLINFHAVEIARMPSGRPLPVEFIEKPAGTQGRKIVISNPRTGTEYVTEDNADYGVILRCLQSTKRDTANYFFIVAGLTSAGTWAACNYLHAHWKSLHGKPAEFAVVLKVPLATPELVAEIVVET
jgi:hypothetical protein